MLALKDRETSLSKKSKVYLNLNNHLTKPMDIHSMNCSRTRLRLERITKSMLNCKSQICVIILRVTTKLLSKAREVEVDRGFLVQKTIVKI